MNEQELLNLENKGDLISRQAVLDGIAEWIADGYADSVADCSHISSLVSHLPSVENKGEWTPITERLPEIHQYVLLSLRSLDVEVGFRAETEPYFYCHGADGCYIEPQNVLAWQPLPEPYKADMREGE